MNIFHKKTMSEEIKRLRKKFEAEKQMKLMIAIGIDAMGYLSYLIPGLAEISDAIIAPISAILVYIFFKKKLKWAAFTFIEELLPFTDAIPSATIAWYNMYVKDQELAIQEMVSMENRKEEAFRKAAGEKANLPEDFSS